jgi:hypothetical protein
MTLLSINAAPLPRGPLSLHTGNLDRMRVGQIRAL